MCFGWVMGEELRNQPRRKMGDLGVYHPIFFKYQTESAKLGSTLCMGGFKNNLIFVNKTITIYSC